MRVSEASRTVTALVAAAASVLLMAAGTAHAVGIADMASASARLMPVEGPPDDGDALPLVPETGDGDAGEEADPELKLHDTARGKPYERAFENGFPKTAKERAKVLSNLYAYLAAASDEQNAAEIAGIIERLWLISGSDTVSVLMERSMKAVSEKRNDVALRLLDAVVDLAPDYAEGWNRRAFVYYLMDQRMQAAGDLRRVLALEPNHFKAMQGLAQILKDAGQKGAALKAYRKLLDVNPFADGIEEAIRELSVEVEGQGI